PALKPCGHTLAFAGTRTLDLMTLGLRLAGFDIRDSVAWLYGSGFPKSHDVGKAIDKRAGAEREVVGIQKRSASRPAVADQSGGKAYGLNGDTAITAPATDAAKQWDGWGTALKPAIEPIVMARKPFKGTVAANVLEHGTGALNIDASRIEGEPTPVNRLEEWSGFGQKVRPTYSQTMNTKGRWPANVILDEHMAGALDEQSGVLKSGARTPTGGEQKGDVYGLGHKTSGTNTFASSEGGASRFFYVAKAPKRER